MSVFLSPEELAMRYSLAQGTINNWRSKGIGPKSIKVGGKVLYPLEEVEQYESAQLRNDN